MKKNIKEGASVRIVSGSMFTSPFVGAVGTLRGYAASAIGPDPYLLVDIEDYPEPILFYEEEVEEAS